MWTLDTNDKNYKDGVHDDDNDLNITLKEEEEVMEQLYKYIVENKDSKEKDEQTSLVHSIIFYEDNQCTLQQHYQQKMVLPVLHTRLWDQG